MTAVLATSREVYKSLLPAMRLTFSKSLGLQLSTKDLETQSHEREDWEPKMGILTARCPDFAEGEVSNVGWQGQVWQTDCTSKMSPVSCHETGVLSGKSHENCVYRSYITLLRMVSTYSHSARPSDLLQPIPPSPNLLILPFTLLIRPILVLTPIIISRPFT